MKSKPYISEPAICLIRTSGLWGRSGTVTSDNRKYYFAFDGDDDHVGELSLVPSEFRLCAEQLDHPTDVFHI